MCVGAHSLAWKGLSSSVWRSLALFKWDPGTWSKKEENWSSECMGGACNLGLPYCIIRVCKSVCFPTWEPGCREKGVDLSEQALTPSPCFQLGASPLPLAVLTVSSSGGNFQSPAWLCRGEEGLWGPNCLYIHFQTVLLPSEVPGPNLLLATHSIGLHFSFVSILSLAVIYLSVF